MSLSFNGYLFKIFFTGKSTQTKTAYVALCAASGFIAGVLTAGNSFAESIDLTPRRLRDHSIKTNGINWLKPPDKSHNYYLIKPPAFSNLSYPDLGIRNADTVLRIDSGQFDASLGLPPQDRNLSIEKLEMHEGLLDIVARSNVSAEIRTFKQTGGKVQISSENRTAGIRLPEITVNGGEMRVDVDGVNSKGITGSNRFLQTGGSTFFTAAGDNSTSLSTHGFEMNGGYLLVQSMGSATAIKISRDYDGGNGRFKISEGIVRLEGDGHAGAQHTIYGDDSSHAFFGGKSVVQPVLDTTSSGQPTTGFMSFGHVEIEKGAAVEVVFKNAAALNSSKPVDIPFLESRISTIDGEFTKREGGGVLERAAYGPRLFYDYELVKVDGASSRYSIRLRPKVIEEKEDSSTGDTGNTGNVGNAGDSGHADRRGTPHKNILKPSHKLTRASYNATAAVEAVLPNHPLLRKVAGYDLLDRAYGKLYNSKSVSELERHARGLQTYQTTRFPSLITTGHDRFSYSFQRELTRAASHQMINDHTEPDAGRNAWAGWIKPLGGNETYKANAASYRSLDVNYGGLTIGTAGRYRNVTTGMAVGFMQGRLKAPEGYRADALNLLVTTGLTTDSFNISKNFKPFLDLGIGYGWSRFDQNRRDTLGGVNNAVIKADSLRLTVGFGQEYFLRQGDGLRLIPKATLDYTYIRQNKYREHGGYLPLSVAVSRFNSLRPKIGSELLWAINPQLALNAYGYYRYEVLDSRANLDTRFVATPDIRYVTVAEEVNRSSANIGFEMTYQVLDNITVSGSYDLLFGRNYEAHQLYVQSNARF